MTAVPPNGTLTKTLLGVGLALLYALAGLAYSNMHSRAVDNAQAILETTRRVTAAEIVAAKVQADYEHIRRSLERIETRLDADDERRRR